MKQEVWKDIEGYEGLYQVSNYGKIKSLPKKKGWCFSKEKILKQHKDKDGYLRVTLCKNGKLSLKQVHRVVATAFIPNSNNLPEVNHKDINPINNNANNLEWCTQNYNLHYGNRNEKISKALSKAVLQLDLDNNIIAEFSSITEAANKTKNDRTHISECCKKLKYHKTHGGYKWKFKEEN